MAEQHPHRRAAQGRIRLRLRNLSQLFNSLDPSPFIEKDLDPEAGAFIVSWAREHAAHETLHLEIYLQETPADFDAAGPGGASGLVREGVHNYFSYRAEMTAREFRQLMREGRRTLMIGLCFLAACIGGAELIGHDGGPALGILRESLLIGGWVAMWRPLEIFLYDWWPVRRSRALFLRLARMQVEVVVAAR